MRAQNVSGTVRVLCQCDRDFKEKEKRPTEKYLVMSRLFFCLRLSPQGCSLRGSKYTPGFL